MALKVRHIIAAYETRLKQTPLPLILLVTAKVTKGLQKVIKLIKLIKCLAIECCGPESLPLSSHWTELVMQTQRGQKA